MAQFSRELFIMLQCCVKYLGLVAIALLHLVTCRYMEIGSPVLDCIRIRNLEHRSMVFGTGYFHTDDNQRYVGTWDMDGTPFNSAFKIERIDKYKEPLYFIRTINTQVSHALEIYLLMLLIIFYQTSIRSICLGDRSPLRLDPGFLYSRTTSM